MTKYDVLRFEINDGHAIRPMYIGSMPAGDLNNYCRVPSFNSNASHDSIATALLNSLGDHWQRPLIKDKADSITARYDQNGEFMPNPVLLSAPRGGVKIGIKALDGKPTGLYALEIVPTEDNTEPLLVLDGQHRIFGLANGNKAQEPIPFVLLYSQDAGVYTAHDSAKIFAEVSTGSTPLESLHREWMQYAFGLGPYPKNKKGEKHRESLEVAIHLCEKQYFPQGAANNENEGAANNKNGIRNPFHEKIQFNPGKSPSPAVNKGFKFSANEIKDTVFSEYRRRAPLNGIQRLTSEEVAEQIALATLELQNQHSTPLDDSCFFGDEAHRQSYMEQAFLWAVVSKLLRNPAPDWNRIFQKIKISQNIWDFSSWVKTTGGNDGNASRAIAKAVMIEAIRDEQVPPGAQHLVEYMRRPNSSFAVGGIEFLATQLTRSGNKSTSAKKTQNHSWPVKGVATIQLNGPSVVQLLPEKTTSNLGTMKILDVNNLSAKIDSKTLKKGLRIAQSTTLHFEVKLYGGYVDSGDLTIVP